MASLVFRYLPLVEVTLTLGSPEVVGRDFDSIVRLREYLASELPVVSELTVGRPGGTPGALGYPEPAVTLQSEGADVSLKVDDSAISVRWARSIANEDYAGYEFLLSLLERCLVIVGEEGLTVAQMTYTNHVPEGQGGPQAFLDQDMIPEALRQKQLHGLDASWRLSDGVDYRLSTVQADRGHIFSTTAGRAVSGSPLEDVRIVHDALQDEFERVISAKAKELWGFDGRR